ncbi:Peroxidase superfamily protein [Trifolium repens]|nr:Peroxidase superfamily protein [Trifolium repens]
MSTTILLIFIFFSVLPFAFGDLRVGFYSSSCPRAELIVHQVVERSFNQDRSITAALLRMHFHDCFVRGCDASILIDSQKGNQSEKDAGANRTVRGYNLIDEIKRILENVCPLTVSCADIIALATRDSVVLAGGPSYNVPTGRHDGLVSSIHEVNLPGPESSIKDVLQVFNSKGMTMEEMVILLGAHTVGFTHCSFIKNRINNQSFLMDNDLRKRLVEFCGVEGKDPLVFLDQNTSFVFDNQFYNQILLGRGVLSLDQNLALDSISKGVVTSFARNGESFLERFADAMIKLGTIDVLVGNQGEIRKNCRVFN